MSVCIRKLNPKYINKQQNLSKLQRFCCLCYCKDTKLKAIHNGIATDELKNAVVIENVDTGKVRPGATVVVKNLKMNKEFTYKIVGSNEADPLHGLLSDESPVGLALMDKAPGEIVSVETPAGVMEYEIIEILKKTGEN